MRSLVFAPQSGQQSRPCRIPALEENDTVDSFDMLRSKLQAILPTGLIVACSGTNGDPSLLSPEEWSAVSAAVPKRQREFAAGRATARRAMRMLTGSEAPILSNIDRAPDWPVGMVGSIAHTSDICFAVVGLESEWQAIGIDIEASDGLDETLWDIICTPQELYLILQLPIDERAISVTKTFVAKEAFYKWHYPQKELLLDFQDISLLWRENSVEFKVTAFDSLLTADVRAFEGRLLKMDGYLIGCCWSRLLID